MEPLMADVTNHVADFYRDDVALVRRVTPFLAQAVEDGGMALAICTPHRARSLEVALGRSAVPLRAALPAFVVLDAQETLDALLVDGAPDPDRFEAVLGRPIRTQVATGRPFRAYGEMVDLLWQRGRVNEVLALEELWNALRHDVPFDLYCAYDHHLARGRRGRRAAAIIHTLHGQVVDPPGPATSPRRHRVATGQGSTAGPRSVPFPPDPESVSQARRFVREALEDCDEDLVADVQMVTSELATNAVVHARTDYVVVVDRSRTGLRLTVADSGPGMPRTIVSAPLAESGRGLQLVDRLSARWGVRCAAGGKFVWAEFEGPPPL
ncbi:MAG: MEDS domain-containing protein [Acidimicrobiales bacterium]|nr:MEDS domain-containing protein [Acidimicrobiales bacterium]